MKFVTNLKTALVETYKDLLQEWRTILIFVIPIFLVLLYWAFQNTNIGFLQIHSIDEYVFHGSLRHMLESALSGKLSGIFGYGFYQYGFIYFFLNLLGVTPAILLDQTTFAIAIPRVITSLFAVGSLVFIYKFSRLYIEKVPALLFTIFFVTMPAFWYNATWFHPDWPMTFWLLGFVYFLAKDKFEYSTNFWFAVLCYALAIAFKYQAITALPLLGLYVFYDNLKYITYANLLPRLKMLAIALISTVSIFILANPYILHPMGWNAFSGSFLANMESNAQNHGSAHEVTLIDKVNFAIGDYYLNIIFFFIFNLAAIWLAWRLFRKSERSIFPLIAINYLINITYLLLFVNKAWQMYYLPVMTVGILLFIYFIKSLPQVKQKYLLVGALIVQLLVFGNSYHKILSDGRDSKTPDFITYTPAEQIALHNFLIDQLQAVTKPNTVILLSPYTPLNYELLGIPYEQVKIIFGALAKGSFDREEYIVGQKAYWGDLKTEEELASSFKPVDFIVIRKDIPFMSAKPLEAFRDQTAYNNAKQIVADLYAEKYEYKLLAENEYVVIFANKK